MVTPVAGADDEVVIDDDGAGAGAGEQHVGLGAAPSPSWLNGTMRPPTRWASCAARASVRLVTVMSVAPAPTSATAMPSPISPAPTTSTLRPASAAEAFVRHLDRGVADRRGVLADDGLGAGPLAGLDGVTEQQVQRGLGAALGLRDLPRAAHLAEDLALAEHRRIEPGRHLEQVG